MQALHIWTVAFVMKATVRQHENGIEDEFLGVATVPAVDQQIATLKAAKELGLTDEQMASNRLQSKANANFSF